MSHNTYLTFLFFEDNDSISAKSELIFYNHLKLFFKIILNNNFSQKLPIIFAPFKSLILYVQGLAF